MNYLVVDSGGTKTDACVVDEKGRILGFGRGEGGNAVTLSPEIAFSNVVSACKEAMTATGVVEKIKYGYFFIPGYSALIERTEKELGFRCVLKNESDELHYSALGGADGIVVLAGTGSFATAYVGDERYSVGGWGHIFSDEGSGYDIGMNALRCCAVDYDDGKNSLLLSEVTKSLGYKDFLQARRGIYCNADVRKTVAELCKTVCALSNDEEANAIITDAASKLCNLALRCLAKSKQNSMVVTLAGGLAKAQAVKTAFIKAVGESGTGLIYKENKSDVLHGAILKTLADDGVDINTLDNGD